MPPPKDAAHRDLACVCCGRLLYNPEDMRRLVPETLVSQHHRILGNTKDNRLSNKILLYGSGSVECHWRWHVPRRPEAERLGYIIPHGVLCIPTLVPVWYWQPFLGRIGWQLLTDAGDFLQLDYPKTADAADIALDLHHANEMESDPT